MNRKHELSVYGYVRQNFERECMIQEIIATILQFYKNKGGFLYVCGDGASGRLGISKFNRRKNYCKKPTRVQSVKEIVDIAADSNHTMLVDYYGRIWAFGCGEDGRLGTGNTDNVKVPKQIQLNQRAIAVRVGYGHSLILSENGNVLSCGSDYCGQLGHGDHQSQLVPKCIEALKEHKIIQISAGDSHNGALSETGDLFMWGNHRYGQCGVGKEKKDDIYTPTVVKLKEKVSVIECGNHHSLLITMSNLLYSFGSGINGNLGHGAYDGTYENKFIPSLIDALKDVKIASVAGGYEHTLCVDVEFNVWSFGRNGYGECGYSGIIYYQYMYTPKKIEYFAANNIKAKEVAAGSSSSCVIAQNNECFVFGNNEKYQLGLEDNKRHFFPSKLELSVQKVSMGHGYSTFISDSKKE